LTTPASIRNLRRAIEGETLRLLIVYALVILSIVGPGLAVAFASRYISLRQQQDRAESVAAEVLRRSQRVSTQMRASFDVLGHPPGGIACSEAHIDLMRRMVITSNMLLDVGFARDNELICSSFGNRPIDIGAPSYVSASGNLVRIAVSHPLLQNGKILLITQVQSGITVEIHEDTVLEVSPRDADLAIGLIGWSKKRLMMHRGQFDMARLQVATAEFEGSQYDGHSLLSWKRSHDADFAAVVVVESPEINRSWRQVAWMLVPMGILTCLSLLFVVRQFTRQQASLPSRIKRGLARHQFFLVYQPIVELGTGRTVGAEALVRWRRDDGELVSPDVFIPVAEQQHLIREITERVISLCEHDASELLRRNPDLFIAINLSADDMSSEELPSRLRQCISHMNILPEQLHVEATERVFINHETIKRCLRSLRAEGIPTAIDDFGTGYSSLAYLTDLEVDYIKIDKAFVDTIGTDSVTSHVVAHIIELAKSLNLKMIAEGVEHEHQASYLRDHGVQFAQGWLFSKPMNIDQFAQIYGAE
jgi:sensor c-di-GMP phosphodiesterase-like protein